MYKYITLQPAQSWVMSWLWLSILLLADCLAEWVAGQLDCCLSVSMAVCLLAYLFGCLIACVYAWQMRVLIWSNRAELWKSSTVAVLAVTLNLTRLAGKSKVSVCLSGYHVITAAWNLIPHIMVWAPVSMNIVNTDVWYVLLHHRCVALQTFGAWLRLIRIRDTGGNLTSWMRKGQRWRGGSLRVLSFIWLMKCENHGPINVDIHLKRLIHYISKI